MTAFALGFAVVSGRSMEPTLYDGDRLLVCYGARPKPGRLAVIRLPNRPVSVKRLVSRLDDGWWVSRDNPAEGVDSGQVGTISDSDVLAAVVMRVWPPRFRCRRVGGGRTGAAPRRDG